MIICKILEVTPEWLLSGIKGEGDRAESLSWYAIDKNSEVGRIIEIYNDLSRSQRDKLVGFIEAIKG